MQISHLSASRIETYLQCPHKYYLLYEEKKESDAEWFRIGRMVHGILENIIKQKKKVKDVKVLYDQYWQQQNEVRDQENYLLGLQLVSNFVENVDINKIKKNLVGPPEEEFNINLKEFVPDLKDDIFLNGRIDLKFKEDKNTLHIIDFKTSSVTKSTEELKKDLQMRIYALVCNYLYPDFKEIKLTLWFLKFDPVTVILKEEDLVFDDLINYLISIYYQIRNDQEHIPTDPTKNVFCRFCTVKGYCQKYREAIKAEVGYGLNYAMMTPEELVSLRDEYISKAKILEKEKETIDEILSIIISNSKEGYLNVGNGEKLTLIRQSYKAYDSKSVVEIIGLERFLRIATVYTKALANECTPEELENIKYERIYKSPYVGYKKA